MIITIALAILLLGAVVALILVLAQLQKLNSQNGLLKQENSALKDRFRGVVDAHYKR